MMNNKETTVLHEIVRSSDLELLEEVLKAVTEEYDEDHVAAVINTGLPTGTPLHQAVWLTTINKKDIIETLIRYGANTQIQDDKKRSPSALISPGESEVNPSTYSLIT